jgi:two-component system, LytTR family, sensor kinase
MNPNAQVEARQSWLAPLWRALGLLAAFTVLGVFNWVNATTTMPSAQTPSYFVWFVVSWLLWAPVVPPLAMVIRRLVATRASALALTGAVTGCFLLAWSYRALVMGGLSRFSGPLNLAELPYWTVASKMWTDVYLYAVIAYVGIAGLLFTAAYRKRLRAEQLAAAQLEANLTRAELDSVRVQLHPQLIFDALQTTSTFIQAGKSATAIRLLARLSDLLRLMLATLGQEEVPLRQELEFLDGYLSLQQIRAPGRLSVRMDIAPEALEARVPSLTLMQLAELPDARWGGRVEVSASGLDGMLRLRLRHLDGAHPALPGEPGDMRLTQLRARLEHLYPGAHDLAVRPSEGGLDCSLIIPLVAATQNANETLPPMRAPEER